MVIILINMKTITFILFVFTHTVFSQCLSGDCKNGFGKYDYGFAVYEGNFTAEKANGKGTIDYGNGEKFVGNFKNGSEDGDGILYKNNVAKNVKYVNGKIQIKNEVTIIGGNAPKVEGCIVGDCYNGYGEMIFDSGNTLKGEFLYGLRNGKCAYTLSGGNTLVGNYIKDDLVDGVSFYKNEGITFTGTFSNNSEPKTGKYYYAANKATVEIVNGKITKVDNPVAREAERLAAEQSEPRLCSKCGGKGFCGGEMRAVTTENYYSINYVHSDGSLADISFGNRSTSTKMEKSPISVCSACNGTGKDKLQPGSIIINGGRY